MPTVCTLGTETFVLTSATISNSKVEIKIECNKYEISELNSTLINSNISDNSSKSLSNIKKRLTDIKLNTRTKIQEFKSENIKFKKHNIYSYWCKLLQSGFN